MSQDRQDEHTFLQALMDQAVAVSVYLVNGIKLQGSVVSFDHQVVLLGSSNSNQMIYKHAISTIVPNDQLDLDVFDQQGNRDQSN